MAFIRSNKLVVSAPTVAHVSKQLTPTNGVNSITLDLSGYDLTGKTADDITVSVESANSIALVTDFSINNTGKTLAGSDLTLTSNIYVTGAQQITLNFIVVF